MTTGELIKFYRVYYGFTQEELGSKIGVSGAAISQFERADSNPRMNTICKIAAALGITAGSLLYDNNFEPNFTIIPESPTPNEGIGMDYICY